MLVGVSWLTTRNSRGSGDFFVGDRRSPWYVVAIAMIGTSISGVTFVSVPGMVAASQFSYLQMVLGFVAGYVVVAYVLLPLYYRLNMYSIYGYLEQRFGLRAYRSGSMFFLLSKFLGCGVRMYLTALVLQLMLFDGLGVPFWFNVLITMSVVYLYTFRGGVKTLVWADMVQTLSLIIAVVLAIVYIAQALELTMEGVVTKIAESPMSRVWFFDDVDDKRYFFKQFLAGMFTTIAMTGLDQDMMQKNLSCKSLADARKNVLSYGVAFLPVNLLFLALGVLLYIYASHIGLADADGHLTMLKPDELFPYIATSVGLPTIVGVLFVVGIVAAAFSSAGSAVTALTTSVTIDMLRADRHNDTQHLTKVRSRVHIINCIVMGVLIWLFQIIGNGSVIDAVYVLASYTYGPLLGMYVYGLYTKRDVNDKWMPYICVAAPLLSYVISRNSEQWFEGYKMGYELLLVNGAITICGMWLSRLKQTKR
jgi:SSS family transporter